MDWWKKPLRIADFSLAGDLNVDSIPEVIERKRGLGFDTEHLGVRSFKGGDNGVCYFQSDAATEVPFDFLGPYLEQAHTDALRVLIYLNVHWLNPTFASDHPDWLQRRSDDSIIDTVYGAGNSPCVNSPGYRDWSFRIISDLAVYEIDGIFLDGPIFISDGCWCVSCREKFEKRYGTATPEKTDWTDQTWKQFIEFRYDSITEYMRDARKILLVARPGAIIYMNGQGLWPSWPNGRDNRRLAEFQDIVGAEGGFIGGDLRKSSLWKPSMSAKLLETQAAGKPRVVFIAGKNCGWDRYALSAPETRLLFAQTIACGASPWYGMFYTESDSAGSHAAGEMNRLIGRHLDYLENTSSPAEIALMWSTATADYYRATVPVTDFTEEGERLTRDINIGDHFKSFSGYFELLSRRHIQFDVVDETAVTESLNSYRALILPNVACVSDRLAGRICDWVKNGGLLVSTCETSFYNEWGESRDISPLSELFGFSQWRIEGPCERDFFDGGTGERFDGIDAPLIPSPSFRILPASVIESATTSGMYRELYPARYQPLPPTSPYPAIIENRYGQGRSVVFCGNFAEHYFEFHIAEHAVLLTSPITKIADELVITDAPETLQIIVRNQPGRLIVHCINMTGEMTRPIERIIPLHDISLRFPQLGAIESVTALIGGDVEVEEDAGNGVRLTIPLVDFYEILVVELTTP